MENEKIYTVLTDILDEQKENTKLLLEIKTLLKKQEKKLNNLETKTGTISVSEMQQQLSGELKGIKVFLTSLPKHIRQEKRFLLFPEYNAKEYYSVVLRWFLYLIVATYAFWIIRYAISLAVS